MKRGRITQAVPERKNSNPFGDLDLNASNKQKIEMMIKASPAGKRNRNANEAMRPEKMPIFGVEISQATTGRTQGYQPKEIRIIIEQRERGKYHESEKASLT